jgi:hypothetical protein
MSPLSPIEQLGEEIASLSAHLDAAAHRLLECIREFDQAGGWHEQGALSCAHWLAWRVGWDTATAREKVRVARALGKLPLIDEAFSCACLSYAKVRALTRVATPQNEGQLLELAMMATAAQLERICRGCRAVLDSENEEEAPRPEQRCVHQHRLPGGMVMLELVLEPDEADLVLRAIERAQEEPAAAAAPGEPAVDAPREEPPAAAAGVPAGAESGRWPSRADGAVRVAESYLSGHPVTGNGGERFQVMVHLGQEALAADGQWAATLEDGSRLSAETLRRVACDCGLVAVGGDGEGENLNIGRRSRSIPPALRRALMVRDHGCAFPGCSHTRFLHAHHIEHWLHGGETSLENTVLACSHHHHLLHEGGWTISRDADGSFVFHSPSGRVLAQNPPRERVENIGSWMREWADEHSLELGPEVNMPLWDGSKPDYDMAISWPLEYGEHQGAAAHPPRGRSGHC